MAMIDIHILTILGREILLDQALESAHRAGNDLTVHVLHRDGAGSINAGRVEGYSRGTNPYVAVLDDDDLLTGTLSEAIDILESRPELAGAYYDETRMDLDGGKYQPGWSTGTGPWTAVRHLCAQGPHHLAILRRSALIPRLAEIGQFGIADIYLANTLVLDHGPLHHIDDTRYVWRQHAGQVHNTGDHAQSERHAAVRRYLLPTLLAAMRRQRAETESTESALTNDRRPYAISTLAR